MRFLKNLFTKKDKKDEPIGSSSSTSSTVAELSVLMNDDASLDLVCIWNKNYEADDFAFAVGTMLRMMTNGEYDKMIIDSLEREAQTGSKDFITQVLAVWQLEKDLQQTKGDSDKPVMSPLQTFGESNFGMMQ